MIRKVIKPQYTNLTINIPTSYIDKEIELIIFPLEENEQTNDTKKKQLKKSLRGVFNQYADSTKTALEDNAWQNHIIDKFKQND